MKTIIAGSRSITDPKVVERAILESKFNITEVVSGGALGVDRIGEDWAWAKRLPVKVFPAKWEQHGKAAGHLRNAEMADYAEALIAVWDGRSRGTGNMIEEAAMRGLKVHIKRVEESA